MAQWLRSPGAVNFLFMLLILQVRTPVRLNLRVCRLSILVGLNHKIFLCIPIVFVYILYITST